MVRGVQLQTVDNQAYALQATAKARAGAPDPVTAKVGQQIQGNADALQGSQPKRLSQRRVSLTRLSKAFGSMTNLFKRSFNIQQSTSAETKSQRATSRPQQQSLMAGGDDFRMQQMQENALRDSSGMSKPGAKAPESKSGPMTFEAEPRRSRFGRRASQDGLPVLKGKVNCEEKSIGGGHESTVHRTGDPSRVVRSSKKSQPVADLNREFQIWSKLDHPNIAKLHGAAMEAPSREKGRGECAISHFEMESLTPLPKAPITDADTLRTYVKEELTAIVHMHDAGFMHGDIGVNNTMLGANGEIKVIDFGESREITDPGKQIGNDSFALGSFVLDLAGAKGASDLDDPQLTDLVSKLHGNAFAEGGLQEALNHEYFQ